MRAWGARAGQGDRVTTLARMPRKGPLEEVAFAQSLNDEKCTVNAKTQNSRNGRCAM